MENKIPQVEHGINLLFCTHNITRLDAYQRESADIRI